MGLVVLAGLIMLPLETPDCLAVDYANTIPCSLQRRAVEPGSTRFRTSLRKQGRAQTWVEPCFDVAAGRKTGRSRSPSGFTGISLLVHLSSSLA